MGSLGLPPVKVPGGFKPMAAYIGSASAANIDGQKVKERAFKSTLLVRFLYPNTWLVETPTITENGEAGNIGASNYQSGDSCTFSALPLPEGKDLTSLSKDFFKVWVPSQMSSDVYQDVKVKKLRPVKQADGTEMVLFDFSYTLLTRNGFSVDRQGVASAMIVNDAVVGVVTATTALRSRTSQRNLRRRLTPFAHLL